MPEPLTDRDLADLLSRDWLPGLDVCHQGAKAIRRLLAEVERLRAERAAFVVLAEEVTKYREHEEEWCGDRLPLHRMAWCALDSTKEHM